MKTMAKAMMIALLLGVAGKMYAYDFSAVCETGQTLYYNIIDAENHYVELTCPGMANYSSCWLGFTRPTGAIILPETIQNDGPTYTLTAIGDYAFSGCIDLTSTLTIPNSVTTIGKFAFCECIGFTGNLVIPNSVTTIGEHSFYCCYGLQGSLTIGNSVTTIGGNAFAGCNGFTGSLTIPDSVTTIGNFAFFLCNHLWGQLTIPNSVISIGHSAFRECNNLSEIMMLGTTPPSVGDDSFPSRYPSYYPPIYVPYESLNDYKTAWSSYQSRIYPWLQKSIEGYGEDSGNWHFIASPRVANITPTAVAKMITGAYDLYRFDQSEFLEWRNYEFSQNTPSFRLVNGQGYLYANQEDVNLIFKGNFNEDETKEVALAYTEDNPTIAMRGWNLVGNPFPVSAYADRSYYVMNEDGTGLEPVAVSMETAIPACTGVMVKAEATGESVTFSKTVPEAAGNQGVLQIAVAQANQRGASTGSATVDKAIVSFNAGDALEKFVFNADNAQLYIPQGGKDYAIAYAEKLGEMPLNFKAMKNGEYTLAVNLENVEIEYLHLIDNLTGADVDLVPLLRGQGGLNDPATYTFTAKTSDYASRFRLVFSVCRDADGDNESFAFFNGSEWVISNEGKATLQVIDMTGRILSSETVDGSIGIGLNHTSGVYMLRLVNSESIKTQKIVIK